jgi:type I restriction enzyme S subunit
MDSNYIPKGWFLRPLGEIASFSQGIQVGTEIHISEQKDGYQRFIRIVDYTQPNHTDIRYVPAQGNRYWAKADDIIMIRYGTPGVIGRGIEGVIANNMFKIEFSNLILNDFAEHYFKFSTTLKKLIDGSASSTMPAINFGFLKKLPFIVPPLPEQQKIAEILSTVDAKIEIIDQQISETQELKKRLMQQLLTKGIGHTEFKDSALGKIPKSWEVVKLGDVSSKVGDGLHSTPKYVEKSNYYFVNGNNLINGKLTIFEKTKCVSHDEYEKLKIDLKCNSILMSINGTIGNLALYKSEEVVFGKSAAFISTDNSRLDYKYLYFYLQTSFLKKFYSNELTGSTIKNLSLKTIRNTPVFLPVIDEQKQIAEILSTTDKKLEVLSEKKTTYQELKQGLMQQLLTGKVRV